VSPSAFIPIQTLAPMHTYVLGVELLRRLPGRRPGSPIPDSLKGRE